MRILGGRSSLRPGGKAYNLVMQAEAELMAIEADQQTTKPENFNLDSSKPTRQQSEIPSPIQEQPAEEVKNSSLNRSGEAGQEPDIPEPIQEQLAKTVALMEMGRDQRVLEILDEVLESGHVEQNSELAASIWNDKGLAYKHLGDIQKAQECYDNALEIDPNYAVAWINKGKLCLDVEKWHEAVHCGEEATRLEPGNAIAWNNKGFAHLGLRELDNALICFEQALEIKPEYQEAWNNKGVVYLGQKQLAQARLCFEKALEIDPEYAMALANYGNVLFLQGESDRSLDYVQRALRIEPDNAMALQCQQWLEDIARGVSVSPQPILSSPFNLDEVFDRVARETDDYHAREAVRELRQGVQYIHDHGLDRRRGATGLVKFASMYRSHQPAMHAMAIALCHMLDSTQDIEVECARNALVGFHNNLGFDTIGLINRVVRERDFGPQAQEQFQVVKDFIRQMRR
jgi:tetratricopeptide (TPR) repeat protein